MENQKTTTASLVSKKAEKAAEQAMILSRPLQETLARMIDDGLLPRQHVLDLLNRAAVLPEDVQVHGGIIEALQDKLLGIVCRDVDRFVSWDYEEVVVFLYVAAVCQPMVDTLEKSGEKTIARAVRTQIELLKNHPALDVDPKDAGSDAERVAELTAFIAYLKAETEVFTDAILERIAFLESLKHPAVYAQALRAAHFLHCQVAQVYGLRPKNFFRGTGIVWAQEG